MPRFTTYEIERFNDRIQNVLENKHCRKALKVYLKQRGINRLIDLVRLWKTLDAYARSNRPLDDDVLSIVEDCDIEDPGEGTNSERIVLLKNAVVDELKGVHYDFIEYLKSKGKS